MFSVLCSKCLNLQGNQLAHIQYLQKALFTVSLYTIKLHRSRNWTQI
jgi:hypothetical protein